MKYDIQKLTQNESMLPHTGDIIITKTSSMLGLLRTGCDAGRNSVGQ